MHVDDVVNALYILASRGKNGESYNVGCGKLTKVREIINILEKLYNTKINIMNAGGLGNQASNLFNSTGQLLSNVANADGQCG